MTSDSSVRKARLGTYLARPENGMNFDERAKLAGYIWEIMATHPSTRHRGVAYLEQVLFPAYRHGFVKLFFNDLGAAIAYVVWAYLAPDVEQRIMAGDAQLHLSEWNEGPQLWILDLVSVRGALGPLIQSHWSELFGQCSSVRYAKPNIRFGSVRYKELDVEAVQQIGLRLTT